jgi:3-methyladenine DNA glycosylase AlkD
MDLNKELWTIQDYIEYTYYLESLHDEKTALFSSKINGSSSYPVLGIKAPVLTKIIKELSKGNVESFLIVTKYHYFEEVVINLSLISKTKDFLTLIEAIKTYSDSWALVDGIKVDFVSKHLVDYLEVLSNLFRSSDTFVVRFSIICFMRYYVKTPYVNEIITLFEEVIHREYYINIAIAWFLQVLFVYNKDAYFKYITSKRANPWIVNKSISKIRDSFRATQLEKEELVAYRLK